MPFNSLPMRLWTRYQLDCPDITTEEAFKRKQEYKANILKHRHNSEPLTQSQRYTYHAKRISNRLICSFGTQDSYYPRTKRVMTVASTNWPNGNNGGRLPSACVQQEALNIARTAGETNENIDDEFVTID